MFRELLEFLLYKLKQLVTSRLFPVILLFLALFGVLFLRMFKLQVVEGADAQQEVASIITRTMTLPPTRGNIYDRNGTVLAYNQLVQNVTVMDDGSYANGYERNEMLLRLIALLDRFGEEVVPTIGIYYDESGRLRERFASENERLRFLRDMYGKRSIEELSTEQMHTTAREILRHYEDFFGVGKRADGSEYYVDAPSALKLIYIRYSLYANFYVRYHASVVAEDVKEETIAAIREHAQELKGVDIAQSSRRIYNDAIYLCHILGYTGYASTEEIESLNSQGGAYQPGDVIGKAGLEASQELALHGKSGSRSLYVNNLGQVKKVTREEEPVAGNDIYLSLDLELQKAIYHLLEQKLAGILINHLKNEDVDPGEQDHYIPIKQAYFQLINNNVLDYSHFASEEAGAAEKRLYHHFSEKQQEMLEKIRAELTGAGARRFMALDEEMQAYFTEMYEVLLSDQLLMRERVDTDSQLYIAYRNEGSISLQAYLRGALEAEWIDVSLLGIEGEYSSVETAYQRLVDYVLQRLEDSVGFSKALYRMLVYDDRINRCDLALALYEQGVLEEDAEYQRLLTQRSPELAFRFMQDKLNTIEISPAQLALDPFSASATVVDVNTGKVLAMVSYPGYDNNRISESGYYARLLENQSTPLFNVATQARTAPGSSFKMVTAAAAMELGVITPDTYLTTHGTFSAAGMKVDCWYYPNAHGDVNVSDALMVSCNDFFAQVGYHLSDLNGNYNDATGMEKLDTYARLLGLGGKSGVEIPESNPVISDVSALTSAIGQGTNLYSCSHLARYATALATRGNIYNMTLLDHESSAAGNLIQSYRGELLTRTELKESTWDSIWDGMRRSVTSGNHADVYSQNVTIAAKTGTAEENELRPDHVTYVSFAPYENPEISVALMIPNGYTSGNTSELAGYIYDYYYGFITYEDILEGHARDAGGNSINE